MKKLVTADGKVVDYTPLRSVGAAANNADLPVGFKRVVDTKTGEVKIRGADGKVYESVGEAKVANNAILETKATQALLDEINKIPSKTKASERATMIGAYDPITGKVAVGSSNAQLTAESLHPKTVAYIEDKLGVKIGEFTSFCKNKVGGCAEVSSADQLIRQGANPTDINFTRAVRPRSVYDEGKITPETLVDTCKNCEVTWPNGTK